MKEQRERGKKQEGINENGNKEKVLLLGRRI